MLFFLLANIISLAAALWVFYDSQKRGYTVGRGLLWAVGVFLVLIVFLPLYLVARKEKKRLLMATRGTPTPSSLNLCFYCRRGYEGSPSVCPHCGQNLRV